ncbi:sensor histidine kinase [Paenibacillus sp. GCM10027626]|uniref:sensor histidine kinase n=1 Tax=Paenibacillus sp. GCM10027626 TaxID=3273411 RepID=UPI00362BE93D
MIYVTLLFIVLSFLLGYKRLSSASIRFMFGIMIGWAMSFLFFILYLSKFNYYHNSINAFFNFSPGTWNHLVLTNFNPMLLIRLMNGGVALFHYSLLCFAVSFVGLPIKWRHARIYVGLAIVPAAQLIFFDPAFNVWLQHAAGTSPDGLQLMLRALSWVLQNAKYVYMLLTFALMIHYLIRYPKIRFLKNYTVYHISILAFVAIVHTMLFAWAPQNLVRATVLPYYHNYLQPPISAYPMLLSIFPYVVFTALALLVFMIYRYNSIEAYYRNRNIHINKSIDTASLGTRAFTHALKNHLLAVRSEADYLQERHADDRETCYSLELIDRSVAQALQSIDHASRQLSAISLSLVPLPLSGPVRQAVSRIQAEHPGLPIALSADAAEIYAYVDEKQMTETVYNLLLNAAEALAKQDNKQIAVTISLHNGWGIITVADNGPGIAAEQLDTIFSPFYSTKSSVNNWGIGLSFCHKIVSGHDGKISVDSGAGQGTVFKIYLPVL